MEFCVMRDSLLQERAVLSIDPCNNVAVSRLSVKVLACRIDPSCGPLAVVATNPRESLWGGISCSEVGVKVDVMLRVDVPIGYS